MKPCVDEFRRYLVPRRVGPRMAVEQHDGRARARMTHAQHDAWADLDLIEVETGKDHRPTMHQRLPVRVSSWLQRVGHSAAIRLVTCRGAATRA